MSLNQEGRVTRICAHRGLSHACPENTLPAFAAAIALGVDEIEFDLWLSRDGVAVVCHDPKLDRTTDGEGVVTEMDWSDIRKADAGVRSGEQWAGIRVPRFEEVLECAGSHVSLNIHIKDPGPEAKLVKMVCDAIQVKDLADRAYIAGIADVLSASRAYAPDVARCCLAGQNSPDEQIDLAIEYGCKRLQFSRKVTRSDAERAHSVGLINNLFWSDELVDARAYVDVGIDVVLTNRANLVSSLRMSDE
jgi:glycerophosphoryl diester phosphodiesterase